MRIASRLNFFLLACFLSAPGFAIAVATLDNQEPAPLQIPTLDPSDSSESTVKDLTLHASNYLDLPLDRLMTASPTSRASNRSNKATPAHPEKHRHDVDAFTNNIDNIDRERRSRPTEVRSETENRERSCARRTTADPPAPAAMSTNTNMIMDRAGDGSNRSLRKSLLVPPATP